MENEVALGLDFNPELIEIEPDTSILLDDDGDDEEEEEEVHVHDPVVEMPDRANGVEHGRWKQDQCDPRIGMEFDSLESARKFYFNYAERLGFRVRNSRFRTSRRDDSIIMRRFVCYKEGFYLNKEKRKDDGKERRKRASIREGCRAMFEAVRKDQDRWVVAKLIREHNHAFIPNVRAGKANKKKPVPVFPVEVGSLFGQGLGAKASRGVVWEGGESFNLMQYFKKMQSKNPAFFYSVQVDKNNRLTNVFWADAKARMAYSYFGDAVALDTTYRKNKLMNPFVLFSGVNHHLQPVVFGCSVILDEREASYLWLFETFLVAMCGHHPLSLVTDQCEALSAAITKALPDTCHRICKWQILSKCKEKLPDICSTRAARDAFKGELKKCIDEYDTVDDFESAWEALLVKYNLKGDGWMQSLYEVRQQWATVYLKSVFFAEMSPTQRSESMNKFFQRNFETRIGLLEFIAKFDQAIGGQYEKEAQADFANMLTGPVLKTTSPIEKQASETYTKTLFAIFQEEFVQSLSYSVDNFQGESICRYHVSPKEEEGAHRGCDVTYDASENRACCSCQKFEFSGIICRHMLRVFSALGFFKLPEDLFLKRWTQYAKSGPVLYESCAQNALTLRYNDLCLDVFKYAAEGATSLAIYKSAKNALQKAFTEVVSAKKSMQSTLPGCRVCQSEWG